LLKPGARKVPSCQSELRTGVTALSCRLKIRNLLEEWPFCFDFDDSPASLWNEQHHLVLANVVSHAVELADLPRHDLRIPRANPDPMHAVLADVVLPIVNEHSLC